jgi:hypothetical protein
VKGEKYMLTTLFVVGGAATVLVAAIAAISGIK